MRYSHALNDTSNRYAMATIGHDQIMTFRELSLRCECERCKVCLMQTPTDADPQLSGSVASEIRAEMARRGITQSTLADGLGEHPTWVSRRINTRARSPINLDDLDRIARVLAVDPAELVKRALGVSA